MRGNREAKRHHMANTILLVLALFLLAFIVCMVVTYWRFQSIPDTLVQCVLGAGGIESLALAAIKIVKVIKEGKYESDC